MEIQLQELIEQIKKDGVEVAETQAKNIVDSAQTEAAKIIAEAKAQADKILSDAKAENDRMVKSSEDAIRQAGRNLLISFRESVAKELDAIIGETVNSVYSPDALAQLVTNVVETWENRPDVEDIEVILNSDDVKLLNETAFGTLKDRISKGITLKANDNFDGGFRISVNNGGAYYDYSAEAVVDMMSNYLSPKVVKLLKEAE
jgi:V/A-type H+-transporting ATPase subunit E